MSDDHPTRGSEAFFGRRKGPQLRGRQQQLLDELLPKFSVNLDAAVPTRPADLFGFPVDRLSLEIGFGGGEHLAHQAAKNPQTGFIGVEPFVNGMAKLLGVIDERNLANIRLYDDDATRLLDWLPPASLDQVDLLYPDPWPKKRHWKRRFVSQVNLARICRVLKDDGIFRFASDIDTYVNWTLNHVQQNGCLTWQAQSARDWREPWMDWIRTRYEAKAIREGRVPCYLQFRKAGLQR